MSNAPTNSPRQARAEASSPSHARPAKSKNALQGARRAVRRDLHFNLSWLGPVHQTATYTLRHAGRRYPLRRHTAETLAAARPSGSPTHFAEQVESGTDVVGLAYVTGPNSPEGFPTLASVAITTSSDSASYSLQDTAQAVVFMNAGVTVLTPDLATTVLGHIANSASLPALTLTLNALGDSWCTPVGVVNDGQPVLKSDGSQYYTYELNPAVLNTAVQPSSQSKALIYSDTSLQGARWNLLPGVSVLDANPQSDAAAARRRARAGARSTSGYNVDLQDGGPNFGLSVTVNGLSEDFIIDLTITNSYIRHTSVFVSFLKADGVTPMQVPDNIWTTLLKDATAELVTEWMKVANSSSGQQFLQLLGSSDNTLKWLGNVGAESTFMGIPVDSTNIDFQFGMPQDQGPVGKIRLLVGSLGVSSGNDWDPTAAWLGLAMTGLIDLTLPTIALITTAGEESNTLFNKIFKSPSFLLSTAYAVYGVGKDIFTGSSQTGSDISSALTAFSNGIVSRVLTASDVAAALAGYFGAEEVEEAIPFVGWGLKVLALEATVEQLAQTIGEVIGSPRVVEFDLTVTMDAQLTLVPDPSTGNEFPATASSFTITAQYTDNTTRTYTGAIADPKVPQLVVDWNDVPVGGMVSFVVAMFSQEGWGVGKGLSGSFSNLVNSTDSDGTPIFAASITVSQELYPLSSSTTYQHNQLLGYSGSGQTQGYQWQQTTQAPTETAQALGTGPSGHVLEALNGLTLSDDLGILGYSWEASGLNIPPVGGGTGQTELYTLQNIGYKPLQGDSSPLYPQAGYMTAPAGYSKPPLLLYLRATQGTGPSAAGPGFFFLDPSGNTSTGFHLRQVMPVTDPSVPMDDPSRLFNLATGTSWGRFGLLPTSLAIHSNGYVVAVNPAYNTLQILQLPQQPSADADAPWAFIPMGPGTGPGRLSSPVLAAIRPDQTILVLEAGNQRIQAFSRGGHPVKAFYGIGTPYWIPLVSHAPAGTSVVYLSMSVDVANFVYVLSQNGNGYDASDFNLDVYAPSGQHLFWQQGLVAAGMAVDLWRNVYTVNFQQISGPAGRTEPSLSQYIPSTPK